MVGADGHPETPGRSWADVGLDGDGADPMFDRFARLANRYLGVPTAFVSVAVEDGAQHYPGALGLPEPWQTDRRSTITTPLCAEVVHGRAPLAFTDLAEVESAPARTLVADLGVRSWAGHPVFDRDGVAVGSVCVLDVAPRTWSDDDLATLEDLAAACSAEIGLRQERHRAQEIQQVAIRAEQRTQLVLEITDMFARATTLADVVDTVQHAARGVGAVRAGIALLDDTETAFDLVRDGTVLFPSATGRMVPERVRLGDDLPATAAVMTRSPLYFDDGASMIEHWPVMERWIRRTDGAQAILPLADGGRFRGMVELGWPEPVQHDHELRQTCEAIAASVSNALDRVGVLEDRHRVASTLQAALLTDLPEVDHLELAASYSTATRTDQVGGDWYDAVVRHTGRAVLTIGDVTGHDMQAAARMGQLRSMLRTLTWSGCDASPAKLLESLEEANVGLGVGASATVLSMRVERQSPGAEVRWSSAGHPPPVVLRADGTVDELPGRPDLLLGIAPSTVRRDHVAHLGTGDTLVLHTDGLVESRQVPYQERAAELHAVLAGLAGCPAADLPALLIGKLVPQPQRDDVAVLVARVR
jgi:serine phosphatase RsbU (regulator of sigma subunit)